MEEGKTNIPKLMLMIMTYTILCIWGFFSQVEVVFFPVFALPFALYVVSEKPQVALQIAFHIIIVGINFVSTGCSILAILIYIVSVIIPAYLIVFFYEQKLPLPNFVMYVAISLCIVVLIFFGILRLYGIDCERVYIENLIESKATYKATLKQLEQMDVKQYEMFRWYFDSTKESIKSYLGKIDTMKTLYASVLVTIIVNISGVSAIFFNAILRKKNKELPTIKQMMEFRLSKVAVVILVVAMMLGGNIGQEQTATYIFGVNLMYIFMWFFEIAGGLGLVGLINSSKIDKRIKILGYIVVVISFGKLPYILMIFGCLDAFLNFRKIDIVV